MKKPIVEWTVENWIATVMTAIFQAGFVADSIITRCELEEKARTNQPQKKRVKKPRK